MYKMKADGSEIHYLNDDGGHCLNSVGDWIYYIKKINGEPYYGGIYRIKKDGSQIEEVLADNCYYMVVIGDTIFFRKMSEKNIYSIKTDGSDQKLILQDRYKIQYDSGYLYFMNLTNLYRSSIKNPTEPELIGENIDSYIAYKNSIYFFESKGRGALLKKSDSDSEIKVLSEGIDLHFNISNDKIYFMNGKDDIIHTMDLEGNNIYNFPKDKFSEIRNIQYVVDDMVYYYDIFDAMEAGADELVMMNSDGSINQLISEIVSQINE